MPIYRALEIVSENNFWFNFEADEFKESPNGTYAYCKGEFAAFVPVTMGIMKLKIEE